MTAPEDYLIRNNGRLDFSALDPEAASAEWAEDGQVILSFFATKPYGRIWQAAKGGPDRLPHRVREVQLVRLLINPAPLPLLDRAILYGLLGETRDPDGMAYSHGKET